MKGFIVYISSEVKDNKQYVYLFGRLENGETFLAIDHFRPYFYIKTADRKKAEKLEKVEFENTQCKSFEDELMTKVTLNLSKDVPLVRDLFIDAGIACYEADIRYVNRYLIDKNLKGAIDLEGEYERPSEGTIDRMYLEPTIKPTQDYFPKLKVLSIDIETDKHARDLYAIGLYTPTFQKVLIKKKGKFTNAEAIPDEERLLERFQELVLEIDPDILTGWNFIDFDLKYLQERFKKNKIEFHLGRINRPCKLRISDSFFKDSSADVPGRMVLDGIHLLKISHIKLDDYKLETASKMFVGEGKIFSGPNRHDQIDVAFEKDPQLLIDYNLKDAKLAYDVIEKSDALNLTIRRSLLTRLPLDRVQGSIAALDSVYLKALQEIKVVAPSSANLERDERIKGGYVLEPQPGIYDNVIVFDFKSLYPSIMRTFNIDPYRFVPAAKAKNKKNLIEAPNGACFKREEGVLPNLIEQLWKERDEAKKRKDKLSTYAIKIMMNCFSPDTDILTNKGMKKITDVKKNDLVYSLNPETKQTELNKVTKTVKYRYKGKMISLQSNCVDFIVTPNHRFFMETEQGYQWFEAQELCEKATKNFWLPKHTPIKGKVIEKIDIKDKCNELGISFRWKGDKLQKDRKHSSISKEYKLEDWLELIGWYISEGYIDINEPKRYPGKVSWRGVAHRIVIAQEQEENRKEIVKLLERMGLKYSVSKRSITITNQILAEILLRECGSDSYNKRIPEWVFILDSKLLAYLFKTLMLGDGDEDEQRYSTCNESLAQDVLRLVHHIGRYGYIYQDKGIYNNELYIMHRVQINRNRGIQPYISKYRNIKEITYNGYVYCVEVSPNHTILAGRNTKLNFCGQSIFGVMANPTCRFYSLEMANAITSFGRFFIQQAASQVEKWGYHVIYGDSLTSERFVTILDENNSVKIKNIAELFNEHTSTLITRRGKEVVFPKEIRALSIDPSTLKAVWSPLNEVIRHKAEKQIVRVNQKFGETRVTADHSLMTLKNGKLVSVKPSEMVSSKMFKVTKVPPTKQIDRVDVYEILRNYSHSVKYKGQIKKATVKCDNERVWFGWTNRKKNLSVKRFIRIETPEFNAFCRLLGAYIAEGSSSTIETTQSRYGASISCDDTAWMKQLKSDYDLLFENTRVSVIRSQQDQRTLLYNNNNGLQTLQYMDNTLKLQMMNQLSAVFFKMFCGQKSYGKKLPDFIFHVSIKYQLLLLENMIKGDGSHSVNEKLGYSQSYIEKNFTYTTKSLHLISGLTLLLDQLGIQGSIQYRESKKVYTLKTCDNFNERMRTKITNESYSDFVYDLNVEGTHTFVDACGQILLHNTDSLFLNPQERSYEKTKKIGTDIQDRFNKYFTEYIWREYKLKSFLEIQFEKVFKKFFLPQVRKKEEGAKKRYAGLVEHDGKEEILYVGLETVRRDWTNVAKKFQQILLDRVFHEQEIVNCIRSFVRELKEGKYDDLLVYRKGIRKAVDSYTKTTPPHIKAARKIGRSGTGIIEYVQTVNGPEALEAHTSPIDYDHYIKKQLQPIAESILVVLGKSFENILKDHKQSSLDVFK